MFGYLLYSSHSSAFSPLFSALYTERETGMLIHKYTFVVLVSHINQQLVASERGGNIFHDPCPKLMPFQRLPCWNEFLPVFPVLGTRIRNSAKKSYPIFPHNFHLAFQQCSPKISISISYFLSLLVVLSKRKKEVLKVAFQKQPNLAGIPEVVLLTCVGLKCSLFTNQPCYFMLYSLCGYSPY